MSTKRLAQLRAFQVANSITECPNGHPLRKTGVLRSEVRGGVGYSDWSCDDCDQSFHVELVIPHHCSRCEYDLCNNCTEKGVARQADVPLRGVKVTGQVDDWLSNLSIHQSYRNDTQGDLEATYVFPIDPDAAIYRVVATIGERRVEAVCKERQQARQEYREAVIEGRLATLGREAHDDLFEMSVGRIPPGETVEVVVSYVAPLQFQDGFDLTCEDLDQGVWKMAGAVPLTAFPRYRPVSETGSIASSDLETSNSVPYRLEVDLQFLTSLPITSLTVPSHQESVLVEEARSKIGLGLAEAVKTLEVVSELELDINVEQLGEHAARLTAANLMMNRDLRFELAVKPVLPSTDFEMLDAEGQAIPTSTLGETQLLGVPARMEVAPVSALNADRDIQDRFRLAGVLPVIVSSGESSMLDQTGELIFLVDCSGSMRGGGLNSPIVRCSELLRLFAHSIPSTATFNVILFGSKFKKLFQHPHPATEEYRTRAIKLAENLRADLGGTEILPPLREIGETPVQPGRVRQVFVLTDGAVTNTQQVIAQVDRDSVQARYFSIGIGEGCSRELVKGIADAGHGSSEFVTSGDLAPTVMTLLERSLRPAVSNWRVDFSQPGVHVATSKTRPIFMGQPGLVYFFGDRAAAEAVAKSGLEYTFRGKLGQKDVVVKGRIPEVSSPSTATSHRLAAKAVITELERDSEYGQMTERSRQLKEEVTRIGTVFNLCSRQTSFVGVETTREPSTGQTVTRQVPIFKPVDRPHFVPKGFRGLVTDCRLGGGDTRRRRIFGGQSAHRFYSDPPKPFHSTEILSSTKRAEEECERPEKEHAPVDKTDSGVSLSGLLALVGDDDLFRVDYDLLEKCGLTAVRLNRPDDAPEKEWFSAIVLAYLEQSLAEERRVWGLIARRVESRLKRWDRGDLLARARLIFQAGTSFC
jgi:hypothetical protein